MNIFYLDTDPVLAAQAHFDSHIVKMPIEAAQLLCTAHHLCGSDSDLSSLYKPTHKNHPSAVWVRQSTAHYDWLYQHFVALCEEYTYRYGRTHKTDATLRRALSAHPQIKDGDWNDPPQCMGDGFQHPADTVQAYRNYYQHGKSPALHRWKKRGRPTWFRSS